MNPARRLLFLLCCCLTACTHAATVDDLVEVKAKITEYAGLQERLWLNDGTTLTFDRVTIQIVAPEKWRGKMIRAEHEINFRPDINWNTVGVEIAFQVSAKRLEAAVTGEQPLHTSDFREVRAVPMQKGSSSGQ